MTLLLAVQCSARYLTSFDSNHEPGETDNSPRQRRKDRRGKESQQIVTYPGKQGPGRPWHDRGKPASESQRNQMKRMGQQKRNVGSACV